MEIEFDPVKNDTNIEKHGFSLDAFELLDFEQGYFTDDERYPYGEHRMRVMAPLGDRLCVAVFTMRGGFFRVISLRKANQRERKHYENYKNKAGHR